MKLKSLAVITLFVLGCSFVEAQTFGFESVGGSLFCDYEQLKNFGGAVWEGFDNLSACGASQNATLVCVKGGVTKADNPLGFGVTGVVCADNIYDAFSGVYTGSQWLRISALKCSTKKYGWVGFAGYSGVVFGDNYGYLSCIIPGRNGAVSNGRLSSGGRSKPRAGK